MMSTKREEEKEKKEEGVGMNKMGSDCKNLLCKSFDVGACFHVNVNNKVFHIEHLYWSCRWAGFRCITVRSPLACV
jgi:hypothetical protein